jgi:hypothetical protein
MPIYEAGQPCTTSSSGPVRSTDTARVASARASSSADGVRTRTLWAVEAAKHLVDGGVGNEPSTADDDDPVGNGLHLAHQVARQQYRSTLVRGAPQERADSAHTIKIQFLDWLVEEEHVGIAEQGGRDSEPLTHAQ